MGRKDLKVLAVCVLLLTIVCTASCSSKAKETDNGSAQTVSESVSASESEKEQELGTIVPVSSVDVDYPREVTAEPVETGKPEDTEWWKYIAPSDYVDEDLYGYYEKDPEDDLYFYPVTDDYAIRPGLIGGMHTYWYGKDVYCGIETISSFNKNGLCIDEKTKYVFEDEEMAKHCCDPWFFHDTYENLYDLYQCGNVIYVVDKKPITDYFYPCTKMDMIDGWVTFYKDCHYLYYREFRDSFKEGLQIRPSLYFNRPYSDENYNVSADDAEFYDKVCHSTYFGTNNPDAMLNVTFGKDWLFGQFDFDNADEFLELREIRVNGKTVTAFTPWYGEEGSNVRRQIAFTELVFDEDTCQVTQYRFYRKDLHADDINFDNFKTQKADKIIEETFKINN